MSNLVFTILGIDKGSKPLDDVGDAADRAGDKLDGLGKTGTTVLPALAGAALVAGTATGAALVGASVLFAGIGIVAAASSTVVKDSYADMASEVVSSVKDMSQPLVPALTGIATQTEQSFRRMRPLIGQAMEDSAEDVQILADGVLGLAEHALPGMATAAARATPAVAGMRDMLHQTGDGVGEFFAELSEGSEESGRILGDFGSVLRDVLGFSGAFFADLAQNGAPSVETLASVLGKVLDIAQGLGEGGLPTMFTAAEAVLGVLDSVLGVVAPLATEMGTLLGVVLAMNLAMKASSTVSTWGRNLGMHMATVGKRAGEADRGVSGMTSRLGMLTGLVGGPWGLAMTGGALLLGSFAAEHADATTRVQSLTDALRESNGAITDGMRVAAAEQLVKVKAYQAADKLGISQRTVTDAYLGNSAALDELRGKWEKYVAAFRSGADDIDPQASYDWITLNDAVADGNTELDQARANYESLNTALGQNTDATDSAARASQRRQQALAAEQAQVLAGIDAEFAAIAAMQGVESAKFALTDATENYNKAVTEEGQKSEASRKAKLGENQALNQLNQSVLQAMAAAGEYAAATSGVTDEADRNRISIEAQQAKALEMAATWQGPLVDALTRTISVMDRTTLAANGVTMSITRTGDAVYKLPGGRTITIKAADLASGPIGRIKNELAAVERHVQINISINQDGRIPFIPGRPTMRARGGPVQAMEMYKVGEEGEELFFPNQNGYIIPADVTRQLLDTRVDTSRTPVLVGGGGGSSVGAGVSAVAVRAELVVGRGGDSALGNLIHELVRTRVIRLVVNEGEVVSE